MRAILYNKHTAVADLELEGKTVTKIRDVLNSRMLPIILQDRMNLPAINTWMEKRIMPEARDGLDAARREFPGFEQYHCMFSLSDQYWFRFSAEESWEKLNFFDHPYQEETGKIFFSPWEVDEKKLGGPSPDLMTNGVLRKRWVRGKDGTSYLLKAGSKKYCQEPLSEVLASITLRKLDFLPFVNYELSVDGLRLCSRCRNFVTRNAEFVPASHIYAREKRTRDEDVYTHLLRMCRLFGVIGAKGFIDNMITADRIIGNTDRHLGNFGFLRSADNGQIIGFAPLFDSGTAYWEYAGEAGKSRHFKDHEDDAIRAVLKRSDMTKIPSRREMYDLVGMYPEITEKKRKEIRKCIDRSQNFMEELAEMQRMTERPEPPKGKESGLER